MLKWPNKKSQDSPLKLKITVFLEREDDGTYYAFSPALKGLHVGGETEREAIRNVQDGIISYLTSLTRHGDPLPVGEFLSIEDAPRNAIKETVTIEWPTRQMCGIS